MARHRGRRHLHSLRAPWLGASESTASQTVRSPQSASARLRALVGRKGVAFLSLRCGDAWHLLLHELVAVKPIALAGAGHFRFPFGLSANVQRFATWRSEAEPCARTPHAHRRSQRICGPSGAKAPRSTNRRVGRRAPLAARITAAPARLNAEANHCGRRCSRSEPPVPASYARHPRNCSCAPRSRRCLDTSAPSAAPLNFGAWRPTSLRNPTRAGRRVCRRPRREAPQRVSCVMRRYSLPPRACCP
jgi:hypothetical protein